MQGENINWSGILIRFLIALFLVSVTYNPEGYSYFHWALLPLFKVPFTALSSINPLKVLAGILLLVGWIVYLQATQRSLGIRGVVLTLTLFAVIIWVLIDWNIFSAQSARAISRIVIIVVALVLATGMSWSHVTRRLSGQVDTDEIG